MENKKIIEQVLEVYKLGGNWQAFLKEQVKKRGNKSGMEVMDRGRR